MTITQRGEDIYIDNYHVVPKTVDPFNKYDYDEIVAYMLEHPEDVVDIDLVAELATAQRAERDRRLAACDWTQVADAPVDRVAWAVYRQALRDVPGQPGFPENILWPEEPK